MSCTNKKKILEIEELSVSFLQYKGKTSRQSWLPVISGLSVAVREGELVAVVGSSGSGKSLLAHAILGILPYNANVSGTMKFQGELMDEKKISELRGKEIAFVPQSTLYLDPLMKVGKQVRGKRGRKGAEKQSELFRRYGLPEELAKAITDEIRKGNHMDTTTKLRQVIEKTLDFLPEKEKKETIKKTCQRTFQALRIDVNREFEVLYEFMEKLPGALKPGGRAAILTFHSGEDKLVKKALKAGYKEGIYSDYSRDVIRPSAQECAQNGRARSTKMRWAIKSE